jgi:hypothetical protein
MAGGGRINEQNSTHITTRQNYEIPADPDCGLRSPPDDHRLSYLQRWFVLQAGHEMRRKLLQGPGRVREMLHGRRRLREVLQEVIR